MATPEVLIARKVGEGVDRPNAEAELPIDVSYQGLADWLVGRQKLPADWNKRLQAIQAKASESFKDLSADTVSKLKGGSDVPMDYFRAVEIRDLLAKTAERTLFGGLTGAAATWDKIVKAYEKGAVYVGEAAQTMVQNVDYEIPYMRKQAAKLNQQISDYERKQAECVKNASACAASFAQECKALGIEGKAIRAELARLPSELPSHFQAVVERLKAEQFEAAARYYRDFSAYAHGTPESEVLLPTMRAVRKGTTGPPPAPPHTATQQPAAGSSSAPAAAAAPAAADATAPAGISWDLGDLGSLAIPAEESGEGSGAAAAGISWDIDVGTAAAGGEGDAAGAGISWDIDVGGGSGGDEASTAAAPGISWDVDVSGGEDAAAAASGGINWDIEMTTGDDAGAAPAISIDWGIDVGAEGSDAAAAAGADGGLDALQAQLAALGGGCSSSGQGQGGADSSSGAEALDPDAAASLWLERDAEFRGQLMDDLQELRAFLIQRRLDLGSSGNELLAAVMPEAVQSVDSQSVASMLAAVDQVLGMLNAPRLRQLLMLSTSSRYMDRMVASLQRKAGQEARMMAASKDIEARRNEARASLVTLAPKVSELVARIRQIKSAVEAELSKLFAGRRVNVLGEINTVLASSGL